MADVNTNRILDASANRATEGLRVVEDFVRFVLDDGHLTKLAKQLRHDLAMACTAFSYSNRTASRDTQQDVGTEITTSSEAKRVDAWDVCVASFERAKQSLRSLEEYSKVDSTEQFQQFEALRYRLYTLEKAVGVTQDSCTRLSEVTLCVLVDGKDSAEEFSAQVQKLVEAGAGMIQLRDKQLADDMLLTRARRLVELTQAHATLAIVNDRVDIAAVSSADGVHLGQDDLIVKDARAVLGPRKLVGVSTHSIEQARRAVLDGANYLGAGPTFPSSTKSFEEFPGLDYLQQVANEVALPTFAIGGIGVENLPQVLETGVSRVAVSGAANDAAELLAILEEVNHDETT